MPCSASVMHVQTRTFPVPGVPNANVEGIILLQLVGLVSLQVSQ